MDKRLIKIKTVGLACGLYGFLWPLMAFVYGSFDAAAWPVSGRATLVSLLPVVLTSSFVLTLVRRTPARPKPANGPDAMRFWKLESIGMACGIYGLLWPLLGFVYGSLDSGKWPIHERGMLVAMLPVIVIAAFAITIVRRSPIHRHRPSH